MIFAASVFLQRLPGVTAADAMTTVPKAIQTTAFSLPADHQTAFAANVTRRPVRIEQPTGPSRHGRSLHRSEIAYFMRGRSPNTVLSMPDDRPIITDREIVNSGSIETEPVAESFQDRIPVGTRKSRTASSSEIQ